MKYFIKQLGNKDCGYTCVKMLLAMVFKKTDFLYYPEPDINQSSSFRELITFANKEGVNLKAYRIIDKDIKKIKKSPFLLPIISDSILHLILVKKVKRKKCLIYDPSYGVYWLKNKDLKSIWNGEYLEVDKIKKGNFKLKKVNFISKRISLLSILFELLSFSSLMWAMYFINKNQSFYSSLILFACYIIFEFLYRKALIQGMKKFDNDLIIPEFSLNHMDFKTRYANMVKFKNIVITSPVEIISLILMTAFGIVLLIINNVINFLIILAIFLTLICFKAIESNTFSYKINKINKMEKELENISKNSNDVFVKKIKSLNAQTYQYASYLNLKKYLIIFIIISLALLYAKINSIDSINFVLFHFFFYLYLSENINSILNLDKYYEQFKYYKALYLYYFNKY